MTNERRILLQKAISDFESAKALITVAKRGEEETFNKMTPELKCTMRVQEMRLNIEILLSALANIERTINQLTTAIV